MYELQSIGGCRGPLEEKGAHSISNNLVFKILVGSSVQSKAFTQVPEKEVLEKLSNPGNAVNL